MWIDGKQQHLGYFKSEIKAAKFVNFVCKKESMKIKNPELSDEETEMFTWPLTPKKVAKFFIHDYLHSWFTLNLFFIKLTNFS